eukprot:COSAG01_NODE_6_length_54687_cov_500.907599_23_plen_87_part_00
MPDYYLASVADKIVIPNLGTISHLGLSIDIQKNKGLLKKIGIKPYVISNGAYKTDQSANTDTLSPSAGIVTRFITKHVYADSPRDP